MKKGKLKGILGLVIAANMFISNGTAFAYAKTGNDSKNSTTASDNSSLDNGAGVLKVNVDNEGAVSYNLNNTEDKKFSWDNASVYYAMTDRFKNGDTSNDHSYGRSVGEKDADNYQNRRGTYHGGDLKGLTEEVDDGYFDKLGVNAIWITAPYEQIHGALCSDGFKHYPYHGYFTLDYTNMDANMGTAEDLHNFIDTAHTHGIRVVFDVVMNHCGYADPVTAQEYGFGKLTSKWKDIYYNWDERQYQWFNDYTAEAAEKGSSDATMDANGDWVTNWWGPDWIRNMPKRFSGYQGVENGGDLEGCSAGLPDFKTESTKSVSIPAILRNKWTNEKRLVQESNELDNFFNRTGNPRTVRYYLVKWLSDWVREYGVDGFRCDTAKNVEVDSWVALKKECKSALKEWRQNNPSKPGAKWTDDFWMTGEVYPHGVGKDYYFTSGAFDSLINFDYKKDGWVFKSPSEIDGIYSQYAGKINNDDNFNVLSYMSTHDQEGLSRGTQSQMIQAGTNLQLLPGGIEIFYGDETNRPQVAGTLDERFRGEMNWGSIDQKQLTHWQKVGKFRSNHIAVGAGSHNKISSSPYTFSRTYNKKGISDKVVVSEPGRAGRYTIQVGNVFSNGQTVRDAYTDQVYTVKNSAVEVQAGDNGLVLLEQYGDEQPSVGISVEKKDYWTDSVTVTLNATNVKSATYSVDGVNMGTYKDGQQVVVGQGKEERQTTTVSVSGVDKDGKTVTADPVILTKIPKPKCLTIHAKNDSWTSAPNVYAYSEGGAAAQQYTGAWPGKAMEDEGDGWYVLTVDSAISANVIFNGSWGQFPAAQQPGMSLEGEVWLYNNVPGPRPGEQGTVTVKYVDQETGKEIADPTKLSGTVDSNYSTTAKEISGYELVTTPDNAQGKYAKEGTTVTYEYVRVIPPVVDGLTIHVKNDSWSQAPNIYVYTGDGNTAVQYAGKWPGTQMTKDAEGWYTFATDKITSGKIIFNGSWGQFPAAQQPGMDVSGDVWIENNVIVPNPNKTGNVVVKYVDETTGKEVADSDTMTGKVGDEYSTSAKTVKDYDLMVTPDNAEGKYTAGTTTVIYKYKPTAKDVVITDFTALPFGNSVQLNVKTNVTENLTYSFWAYTPDGKWELISNSTQNNVKWNPSMKGNYVLWVYVKDASGKSVYKTLNYTVDGTTTRIEDSNSKISYDGSWLKKKDSKCSNGTIACAEVDGTSLSFSFKGTGIKLISTLGPDKGVAKVTIDGKVYSADMYNEAVEYAGTALEVSDLNADSIHKVTVEYSGLYSLDSTCADIDVDAFDITDGDIL